MQKEISIQTKRYLDIYMNPQRQRLLKCMEVHGASMTAKQLSVQLEISPSAVTYHLRKLEELGLVELDHTEIINGIRARYYKRVPAEVTLKCGGTNDLQHQKDAMLDCIMTDSWKGFKRYLADSAGEDEAQKGEMKNSMVYLKPEDVAKLKEQVAQFLASHAVPVEDGEPWEVTVVAYPRRQA